MIKNDALREYADLLAANGFAIYEPSGRWGEYFMYSQVVDGQECFGTVQYDRIDGFEHHMPIKPSVENGSSMFVAGVPNELTVEAARKVAQPANHNHLVGSQRNYEDRYWIDRLYTRR